MGRKRGRGYYRRRVKPKLRREPYIRKDQKITEGKPYRIWVKVMLVVAVTSLFFLSAIFLWLNWSFAVYERDFGENHSIQISVEVPRAAILDGLYRTEPNLTFINHLVDCLGKAGFHVELFQGENVTVNLMRDIGGYKLLVLRLHSAIHTDGWLYLFSGELYTESKYVREQLSGAVRRGYTFNESEPPYFALNSAFLGMNKPEGLKNSIIILMGCNGTGDLYSIKRLLERGVKAYIAWSGYIDSSYSDAVTLKLVRALCLEELSPKEAVEKIMKEIGPDPLYGSVLECYTSYQT